MAENQTNGLTVWFYPEGECRASLIAMMLMDLEDLRDSCAVEADLPFGGTDITAWRAFLPNEPDRYGLPGFTAEQAKNLIGYAEQQSLVRKELLQVLDHRDKEVAAWKQRHAECEALARGYEAELEKARDRVATASSVLTEREKQRPWRPDTRTVREARVARRHRYGRERWWRPAPIAPPPLAWEAYQRPAPAAAVPLPEPPAPEPATVEEEPVFACPRCPRTFKSAATRGGHAAFCGTDKQARKGGRTTTVPATAPDDGGEVVCPKCKPPQRFAAQKFLDDHMARVHPAPKPAAVRV